jgi:hypothetical protein
MSPGAGVALVGVAAFPFAVLFLVVGGGWLTYQLGWWK